MYCPYCATPLTVIDCEARCENGGAFSVNMTAALAEFAASPPADAAPYPPWFGFGRWYCPADAERLVEHEGRLRCPACAREPTNRMLYHLIEFNPHVPADPPHP